MSLTCINGTNVNCTGNMTCTPCYTELPISTFSRVRIVIYILAFLLSLIGNGAIMLVTLSKLIKRETVTALKLLITHLALVDFLFSCNAFILIPNELHNAEADDGLPMCTFKRLFRQVPFEVAIGTIAIIAIERYLGITKDFSHRKWTLKRVMLNLLIVWVISFLIYVPSASSLRLRKKHSDCYEYWKKPDQYFHSAFLLLVEYVIPLCVIGFCNYKIIRVIKDRSKNMPQMQSEEFEKRDKEQRKTVRILIAVVLGFAILALPNQIFFAYLEFGDKKNITSITTEWDVLQMLGIILLLHTSFNAAVYSIMDKKFRKDAKKLCCCCCIKINPRKKRSSTTTSSLSMSKLSKIEMAPTNTPMRM